MIAILYPLKMDKNLSETYSSIYESSLSAGSSGGHYSDGGDGVFRSKQQVANQFNKNIPAAKNGKVDKPTRKAINTSAKEMGIQGPSTVKASHEPEGEMIDEMKAPRMQKGAMAYDGPNKERSEAADRILAKTKAKRKKMKEEVEQIDELKKKTMGSYIAKASKDLADRRFDQGDSEKRKYEPDEADEKEDKKLDKREEGIARAAKKITKEGRYRTEWEEMKLNEMNDYRSKFDEWLDNLVKEGYDIERWSDEELIDTFIDESNLWQSRGGVESALLESDKKGKGSGKKDACYKKVKASAKVWPSAYASGRLVQCRKKGAANYGNSKKEDFSNWRDELNYISEVAPTTVLATGAAGNRLGKVGKLAVKITGNKPAA